MTEPTTNPKILAENFQTPPPNAYATSADPFVEEQNRFGEYGAGMLTTSDNGDNSQLPSQTSLTNRVSDADSYINYWREPTICFFPQVFSQESITFGITVYRNGNYFIPNFSQFQNAYDPLRDLFVSPQIFSLSTNKIAVVEKMALETKAPAIMVTQSSSSCFQLSSWSQLPVENESEDDFILLSRNSIDSMG